MTKLQKIISGIIGVLFLFAIIFATYAVRPTTEPSLGSGSLYVPAYTNTVDAVVATTTLANYPGVLHSITVGTPISGDVVTVYDSATTTASVVMAKITENSSTVTLAFDGSFSNGLTIQQTASSTLTANYQQN